MNMSPANKAHFKSEKEAIHLILTGIGDEIYLIVNACQTAQEKCGKLSKGYNKVNPLTFKKSRQTYFGNSPEWSRFVMTVKQQHKLDEVSYHKLFDILKQYHKEVNELRAERLARNANPLALVATAQANQDPYYQTSNDTKQAQRDKDMQKNLALIAKYFKMIYKPTNNNLRTSSNSRNKNVYTRQFGNQRTMNVAGARENVGSPVVHQSRIQCFNCKEFCHFAKECRKPKRVKDSAYHKEKMLLCKQAEKGVPLKGEKYDWLADTDAEIDEQELEVRYSYMAKIQEVPTADSCIDYEPLEQNNQNDVESDDERVALANLIANLKLDVYENKKIQKQLKKENTTLAQELRECKTILAKTSKTLGESNSVRDSCLVALQNKQTEFEKYKAFNDRTIDYDKLKLKQIVDNAWIKHTKDQFRAPTTKDMDILIKTCLMPLALKIQNGSFIFVHELKQEIHADLKYVESLEKEIEELKSDKAKFSNMYDMILQEFKECDCLAQKLSKLTESVSNEVYSELLQRFAKVENHSISLKFALLKCKEQVKNETVWNEQASNVFRKEREQYIEIQDLKAQLQDKNIAISELKKLIEKGKGKSVETKTSNANAVCATYGKCLVDSNHFSCVTKMLNDVNARTKKPNVVPISTRKPKGHANKSVATPYRKKVASKSTTQKPKSYYRMLYEKTREPDLPVPVPESFHEQTGEELIETDIKRMDADDQAIQTILLGLHEDIYAVVDSFCQTKNLHETDFTQIYDFLKMNQEDVNELMAERLAKSHDSLALMAHSQNSFNFCTTHKDQSSSSNHSQQPFPINNKYNPQPLLNQNFMQPPMTSFEDINDLTEAINAALILFAKAFQLSAPTNHNQRTSSNPRNRKIAQPVMNMGQDRQIQNVRGNVGNQFGQYAGQVAQNQQGFNVWQNDGIQGAQNAGVQSSGNQNGLVVVPGIANQSGTGNVVAARAEGTGNRNQARAPVYNTYGSAKVHLNDNCYDKEIFNMFTQGEKYTDLLNPIPEPQLVLQNDNHVIFVAPSMVQSGGTVETSSTPNEEICAHQETIYCNLVDQVSQASDYDNSDPVPQLQNVSSSADVHVPSQQELDLLFGPLYDEFFTAGTSSVNKSSSPTNKSNQQDTQPTTNIQPTLEPSTPTFVHVEENNNNQAEEEHLLEDEFTNPFRTPVQEAIESSSHNI
nr:hypothetical protein [Tanacetum cinerariifolium]